jgi:thiamine transport system substrate-binding protein
MLVPRTTPAISPLLRLTALAAAAALTMAACSGSDDAASTDTIEPADTAPAATEQTITLVAYESFPSEGTRVNERLGEFAERTGIEVEILIAGDTGTMLSKAELTAGNPEGDVMWGIDSTFLSRAIGSEIFEPYTAAGLDAVPAALTDLVPNGEATPVDLGDVCVNYDIAALDELGLEPPVTLDDLADPAYRDLLVVQNPASSSPGLAFLLATIDEFGTDGWQAYWSTLVDNGVQVVDGWTAAYYEQFSYAGGNRPLVVSYGSSPPFEVLFAETELDTAPTGVVESTCYRQVEFAGVLTGTDQPDEARQLVDFLLTPDFQAALPLDVFVFPANSEVELDPVFQEYAVIPETSRELDPSAIDANRETWIDEWTDLVIG